MNAYAFLPRWYLWRYVVFFSYLSRKFLGILKFTGGRPRNLVIHTNKSLAEGKPAIVVSRRGVIREEKERDARIMTDIGPFRGPGQGGGEWDLGWGAYDAELAAIA